MQPLTHDARAREVVAGRGPGVYCWIRTRRRASPAGAALDFEFVAGVCGPNFVDRARFASAIRRIRRIHRRRRVGSRAPLGSRGGKFLLVSLQDASSLIARHA